MKFFNSKFLALTLVLVLALGVLAGCGSNAGEEATEETTEEATTEEATTEETTEEASDELSGNVAVAGSTSVYPIAQKCAEAFMAKHPNVKVEVQGIGSSAGMKAANEGACDIGTASRNLKQKEIDWGLEPNVVAYDGIAVVVNPNNGVSELTKEQVTKIFKGEIANWKDLGGEDKEIIVVSREEGSGTRGAFEEIMDLEGENGSLVDADVVAEGNGAVRANVAKKDYAVGYISLSYMNDDVKGIKIEGAAPTVENILAGDYKVSRPFLMVTKGEVSELAQAYLDFVFSEEGQEIVAEKNIPVK